jgi:mannose-6-phosphate isomerase-like protein (cupin superfamily)
MTHMNDHGENQIQRGGKAVLGPDDGDSYWQPEPSRGYVTVKLSPFNCASNGFSAGIQVIDEGCSLRAHGHQRNEELLFVYEGSGTATVDEERFPVEPGSLIYAGRFVKHGIVNEGKGPMKILWVFLPPGLEAVLAGLGVPRKPGEPRPSSVTRPDNAQEILARGWFARPDQLPSA